MEPTTQPDQSHHHVHELALSELDKANRHLADAGRTIEELRADALALASRVDQARGEAESFLAKLHQEHRETRKLRQLLAEARTAQEKARIEQETTKAEQETTRAEQENLRSTIVHLEVHIARLKKQLEKPGRQLVKKALRRGRYSQRGTA